MLMTSETVVLSTGRLRELHAFLSAHLAQYGDVPVRVEVGLNRGTDIFVGGVALNVRTEWGNKIIISADERQSPKDTA